MSNKTQLQINNTNLSNLIETLRGKASGGNSGGETCEIVFDDLREFTEIIFVTIENGQIITKTLENADNLSISETIYPIKGSIIIVTFNTAFPNYWSENDCITLYKTIYSNLEDNWSIDVIVVNNSGIVQV